MGGYLLDVLSSPLNLVLIGVASVVFLHFKRYASDSYNYNDIRGPWLAKFSDLWLAKAAASGHRSDIVHQQHLKYGKMVRIAPNHISISDPEALQIVYAHGTGTLKSEFYDAFVSIRRGLFNTRDRAEHTRKRKIVSHIFSQKNVLEFEPYVRQYISLLLGQWDKIFEKGVVRGIRQGGGEDGTNEGNGWESHDGRVWFDCLNWYNYLAFDIIGDLAFGSPFGMLVAGKDEAPVAIAAAGQEAQVAQGNKEIEIEHLPAIKILNDRGDFSATMGTLPPWIRPHIKKLPWFSKGNRAVQKLACLAIAAVSKRLANPTDRIDLLTRLQQGKDANGQPMGREELTAEALTQLIAGSDTTSNSSCAITYYLASNPAAQEKLHQELLEVLGPLASSVPTATGPVPLKPAIVPDEDIPTFDQVKSLPYLNACISEALRLHSTSSMGLARIVPEGGLEVSGRYFKAGSILSVPSYTIHRDPGVWGEDVNAFRPDRWLPDPRLSENENKEKEAKMLNTFNPFSYGPRACVGKNLANMELLLIIASVMRRYEFVLQHPDRSLDTREGFLRKPLECFVGIKRRND